MSQRRPERGHVTIAADPSGPRRAVLTIEAGGLQPGQAHPVRLRAASPAQPSAGFGVVGELVADAALWARPWRWARCTHCADVCSRLNAYADPLEAIATRLTRQRQW